MKVIMVFSFSTAPMYLAWRSSRLDLKGSEIELLVRVAVILNELIDFGARNLVSLDVVGSLSLMSTSLQRREGGGRIILDDIGVGPHAGHVLDGFKRGVDVGGVDVVDAGVGVIDDGEGEGDAVAEGEGAVLLDGEDGDLEVEEFLGGSADPVAAFSRSKRPPPICTPTTQPSGEPAGLVAGWVREGYSEGGTVKLGSLGTRRASISWREE